MISWTRSQFAFVAVLVLGALGYYAFLFHASAFGRIGVPSLMPCFADLRVLFSAADCTREGQNVFIQNPCDPGGYLYNYSTLFLKVMVSAGVTQAQTERGGLVMGIVFLIVSGMILAPRNRFEFLASLGVVLSPAVILGMERGNIDLAIMVGVAAAALGGVVSGVAGWTLAALGIIPGMLVKYYPIMAVPALALTVKKWNDRMFIVLLAAIVLGGYFLFFPIDIDNLERYSPVPALYPICFGGMNLFRILNERIPARPMSILLSCLLFFGAWKLRKRVAYALEPKVTVSLMLVGASVYLGCFCLNSNWEYRRLFLILVFPALFEFCGQKALPVRMLGIGTTVLGIIMLWSMYWDRGLPVLGQLPTFSAPRAASITKELMDWIFFFLLSVSAFFSIESASGTDARAANGPV